MTLNEEVFLKNMLKIIEFIPNKTSIKKILTFLKKSSDANKIKIIRLLGKNRYIE